MYGNSEIYSNILFHTIILYFKIIGSSFGIHCKVCVSKLMPTNNSVQLVILIHLHWKSTANEASFTQWLYPVAMWHSYGKSMNMTMLNRQIVELNGLWIPICEITRPGDASRFWCGTSKNGNCPFGLMAILGCQDVLLTWFGLLTCTSLLLNPPVWRILLCWRVRYATFWMVKHIFLTILQ
jgi:hypothetical protein